MEYGEQNQEKYKFQQKSMDFVRMPLVYLQEMVKTVKILRGNDMPRDAAAGSPSSRVEERAIAVNVVYTCLLQQPEPVHITLFSFFLRLPIFSLSSSFSSAFSHYAR